MIIFVSNFLNHHQYPVASELYRITNGGYRFIETEPMPEWIKNGGYSEYDNLAWLIQTWKSPLHHSEAIQLILNSDVVVWTNNLFMPQIRQRLRANKLTFELGERWLKRGLINLLSPRLIKSQFYYHFILRKEALFRLNASAYAANDFSLMHSYENKMFKWGYFTATQECRPRQCNASSDVAHLRILFVARFLKLKHPELPVLMAAELKKRGYIFELNMFGSGPEEDNIRHIIASLGVDDVVTLCGNRPNNEILQEMRDHDIFLFTSDRHEGWGAVINEAMSQRCAVVASNEVGSVPFLIHDGENGLIYRNNLLDDLIKKVKYLLDNPRKCRELGDKAYQTIAEAWSPENAAKNFLALTDALQNKTRCNIEFGPCSEARPINEKL